METAHIMGERIVQTPHYVNGGVATFWAEALYTGLYV